MNTRCLGFDLCLLKFPSAMFYSFWYMHYSGLQLKLFLSVLLVFDGIVSGIDFIISFSDFPLSAYRNAADFL